MTNHALNAALKPLAAWQKKMGETPIILLPVVAPEPHEKPKTNRTPSDFAIVAIFQDKRKPRGSGETAFTLDLTRIFG